MVQSHTRTSAPNTPRPTVIEILLDETGSMMMCRDDLIKGFNTFINQQKQMGGECYVTLTKFHSNRTRTPYVDLDVNMVPALTRENFIPDDCTNLYDRIYSRINARKTLLESWSSEPIVIFVVMTDGADNASLLSIKDAAKSISDHPNWNFQFFGAHSGAIEVGRKLGIEHITEFEKTKFAQAFETLSATTTAYRVGQNVAPRQNIMV